MRALAAIALLLLTAGVTLLTFNECRGGNHNALAKAHSVLRETFLTARQYAAQSRRAHFVRFDTVPMNAAEPAARHVIRARIHIDTDENGILDGGDDPVESPRVLPPSVEWIRNPDWVAVSPDGRVGYPGRHPGRSRREFDDAMDATVVGFPSAEAADFVLQTRPEGHRIYVDLEEESARLRNPAWFTGR